MHRKPLLELLARYHERYPHETPVVDRVRQFVVARPDCLLRSCEPGHITGSAWILSADRTQFLLGHHKKLDRWLQLGGHADGEPHIERAALREAREESGLPEFEIVRTDGLLVPLDLDVHPIPARANEPEHFHYDVRFLLIAGDRHQLQVSDESHALRWFPMQDLEQVVSESSLLRMGRKAKSMLPSFVP